MKQKLIELKREIDISTTIVGDFNMPFSLKDRTTRWNISKEIEDLNNTINQPDLTDIYRTLYPRTTAHTFFSSAHGTFSSIDHILGHKLSQNIF